MISTPYRAVHICGLAVAATILLGGCTPGGTAAVATMRQLVPAALLGGTKPIDLDPNFAYLRITLGRQVGVMWLGSTEQSPQGTVEVYYSSDGQVMRLRDGRLVGFLGLSTEWRWVDDAAPAWSVAVREREPVAFVRVRDVMPGYRTGVRDDLQLFRTTPPGKSAVLGVPPDSLTWFEERTKSPDAGLWGAASHALPPARYALDLSTARPAVVYSEQCVAHDLCFTWQRWSAAQEKLAHAR